MQRRSHSRTSDQKIRGQVPQNPKTPQGKNIGLRNSNLKLILFISYNTTRKKMSKRKAMLKKLMPSKLAKGAGGLTVVVEKNASKPEDNVKS